MKANKTINAVLIGGVIEAEISVAVDFDYQPGYPAIIRACPGDSEPECPDEITVNSIKADGAQKVELCAGAYLLLDDDADLESLLSDDTQDSIREDMYHEADLIIEEMNEP